MPTPSFDSELARYFGAPDAGSAPGGGPEARTLAAAVADYRAALSTAGLGTDDVQGKVAAFKVVREQIEAHARKGAGAGPLLLDAGTLPALPAEFSLYLQGAANYHNGMWMEAAAAWEKLLALRAEQRRFRSTWAAFMLGRVYSDMEPETARRWYQATRQFVDEGFSDSLDLYTESLGWEARLDYVSGNYPAALRVYLDQYRRGGRGALNSLRMTAGRLATGPVEMLELVAEDADLGCVMTAYYLSHARSRLDDFAAGWLHALEQQGEGEVRGADRLAWVAYQGGDMEAAERWLNRADPARPLVVWLRSRLCFRAGKVEEALELMNRAVAFMPTDNEGPDLPWVWGRQDPSFSRRVHADLGLLRLTRAQFVDAMDAFLAAGYWEDAAYLAERVLTEEELIEYVDCHRPPSMDDVDPAGTAYGMSGDPGDLRAPLSYLLGRRLVRSGRRAEAEPYLPSVLRPALREYDRLLAAGFEAGRSEALWLAAGMAKDRGMELMGTEVEPDWRAYGGAYTRGSTSAHRLARGVSVPGERERLLAHRVGDEQRFHYRYVAAYHAWAASQMMPDDDIETAKVLRTAGLWLAKRDPQAADMFYKALVHRCPNTEMGRQAEIQRWFPP
jgi:tetratricopeptide (TPR) repeat protein